MRDKELQRELWREDKDKKSLEDILKVIRAGKATHRHQSALSNQAVACVHPAMRCHECGKTGHSVANCRRSESSRIARPKTCKASSANCLAMQKSAAPTSPRRGRKTRNRNNRANTVDKESDKANSI